MYIYIYIDAYNDNSIGDDDNNNTNDGGSNLPTASKDVLLIKIDCQPMSIPHPGIFFSCLFFIFHILARISV